MPLPCSSAAGSPAGAAGAACRDRIGNVHPIRPAAGEKAASTTGTAQLRPLAFWTRRVPSLSPSTQALQQPEDFMALRGAAPLRGTAPRRFHAQASWDAPLQTYLLQEVPRMSPQCSACSCGWGWGGTGKTGAGKGEENKGLWTKAKRSSTQREEEEKQS